MKDITVDVILTNTHGEKTEDASGFNSIQVGVRTYEMWRYISAMRDLEFAVSNFPDVNFRYVVYPDEPLTQ